jgi:hypothetical protein
MESPRRRQAKGGGGGRKPQVALELPEPPVGETWRRKESKCGVKGRSKNFIPRGPNLFDEGTGLVWCDP